MSPVGLPPVTWQLAHHCWASWLPLEASAPAGCATPDASSRDSSMAAGSLYGKTSGPRDQTIIGKWVPASDFGARLQ